jgi:predicted  nucleic acid-binding Zn-ribbon protein
VNSELVRTHHGARRHANELVAVLRGPHERSEEATAVLAEVARLTRATWQAEYRTVAREHELWTLRERTAAAEADALASRERAASLERQLDETRALLETRRVRAGLAVGRAADAVRGRT